MLHLDYLLAVAMLVAPVDSKSGPERLRPKIQQIAIKWQLIDPRETRYILARTEDFSSDLRMVRHRYQTLMNAPAIEDSQRFPGPSTVSETMSFNRAYRQHLVEQQPINLLHCDEMRAAIEETDSIYQAWDNLRDSNCDYYHISLRRQSLKKLRDLIGDEAYYNGQMPPPVPIWRFREIKQDKPQLRLY